LWATNLFNFDEESNVPTFYSGLLLLLAAGLLLEIGLYKKKKGEHFAPQWFILSGLFVYLAFDEVMQVHEQLIEPLQWLLAARGVLHFAWVVVGAPLVLVIAIAYLPFFLRLPRRVQLWTFASAATYVTGAIGVEMIGGWYVDSYHDWGFPYYLITTLEETLELVGLSLLICGLLDFIAGDAGIVRVRLTR
jgi:MFS family permease